MRTIVQRFFAGLIFLMSAHAAAAAEQTVSVGGVRAILGQPAQPRGSLILLPGGDGDLGITTDGRITSLGSNQVVRTRGAYQAQGFAILVPESDVDLAQAIAFMARIKRPVTIVATSRGTQRAAEGIAAGARPDKLVLTSGFLSNQSGDSENVINTLRSPALLPPTLVIHHQWDGCMLTQPAGVAPFVSWAGGRARAIFLTGGITAGNPCNAAAYHGFNGIDGKVVSAVSSFAR